MHIKSFFNTIIKFFLLSFCYFFLIYISFFLNRTLSVVT